MRVKDKVEIVLGCVVLASIVFTGIGLEKTSSKSAIIRDSSDNVIITQELIDTGKDYERISQENGCENLDILYDKDTKLAYIRGAYRDVSPLMSVKGTQYKWNEDKGSLETK